MVLTLSSQKSVVVVKGSNGESGGGGCGGGCGCGEGFVRKPSCNFETITMKPG